MNSIIYLIYDSIQEEALIQEGRKDVQKEVEQVVSKIVGHKQLSVEELSDLLYGLALIAEKCGFRSGFISGVKLINELQFPREI